MRETSGEELERVHMGGMTCFTLPPDTTTDPGKNNQLMLKPSVNGGGKQGADASPSRLFYGGKMDKHN